MLEKPVTIIFFSCSQGQDGLIDSGRSYNVLRRFFDRRYDDAVAAAPQGCEDFHLPGRPVQAARRRRKECPVDEGEIKEPRVRQEKRQVCLPGRQLFPRGYYNESRVTELTQSPADQGAFDRTANAIDAVTARLLEDVGARRKIRVSVHPFKNCLCH